MICNERRQHFNLSCFLLDDNLTFLQIQKKLICSIVGCIFTAKERDNAMQTQQHSLARILQELTFTSNDGFSSKL